jgi:hypothetical protein
MTRLCLALILCLTFSESSYAGWLTQLTTTDVGSAESTGEYTWFMTVQPISTAAGNPANCSIADQYVVRSLPRNALAILLAAHTSGKPIRAFVHDTQCDAATGRPLVLGVAIQN